MESNTSEWAGGGGGGRLERATSTVPMSVVALCFRHNMNS